MPENKESKMDQVQVAVVIGGLVLFLIITAIMLNTGSYNMPSEVRERRENKILENKSLKLIEEDTIEIQVDSSQRKPNPSDKIF